MLLLLLLFSSINQSMLLLLLLLLQEQKLLLHHLYESSNNKNSTITSSHYNTQQNIPSSSSSSKEEERSTTTTTIMWQLQNMAIVFFSKYGEFATKKQINPRKSFLAFEHGFFLFLFCCHSAKFGFFFTRKPSPNPLSIPPIIEWEAQISTKVDLL
jgi:hypothetical protein